MQLAATRHGVDGVVEQVQQNLPEGVGVDLQAGHRTVLGHDPNVGFRRPEVDEFDGRSSQVVQVRRDALRRARPGELEQRSDDGAGSDSLVADDGGFIVAGIVLGQLSQ